MKTHLQQGPEGHDHPDGADLLHGGQDASGSQGAQHVAPAPQGGPLLWLEGQARNPICAILYSVGNTLVSMQYTRTWQMMHTQYIRNPVSTTQPARTGGMFVGAVRGSPSHHPLLKPALLALCCGVGAHAVVAGGCVPTSQPGTLHASACMLCGSWCWWCTNVQCTSCTKAHLLQCTSSTAGTRA